MRRSMLVLVGTATVAAAMLGSCDSDRTCERARMHVADAFESLRAAAQERKLAGIEPDTWAFLENKIDLLQSAFATPQVTWNSAVKARDEIRSKLDNVATNSEVSLEFFRRTSDEAFKVQDQYASQCR